jgi:Glycosyltransferase Family 4
MDKAYRRSQFSNDERLTDPATTSYVVDHKEMNMLSKAKVKAPITVLCLITCIGPGGAETMLYKLLSRLNRTRFTAQAISLVDLGPNAVTEKILKLRIPIRYLKMRQGRPNPASLARLIRWLKKDPPDLINTWMYHSDLIGGLAALLVGGIPVAWGIRHSNLNPEESSRLTVLTMKACALLSR